MASKSDRPSLRVLYTQGERDELLRSLIPKPPNLDAEDFRRALKLGEQDFELVETIVTLSFEKSGLSDFQTLSEPDALIAMNAAVLEPVKVLARVLPDVPEWFTTEWCTQIIQYLWQKRVDLLEVQREEIRRGKKRTGTGPSSGQGAAAPTTVSLRNMTFQLVMARNERGSKVFVEELASVRCLTPGKPANEAASYSLVDFIREFEAIVNSTRESPLRLARGALAYRTKAGISRPVQRQQHFEVALNDMFNTRGAQYVLKFHHREENATERNARLAADKAARKLKDEARVPITAAKEKPKKSTVPERGRSPGPRKQRGNSPPPPTPPTRPLPPVPTATLLDKKTAVSHSSERAEILASEVKQEAERAESRAARSATGRSGSRARAAKAEAEKVIRKGERSAPGRNKPLPPLPASSTSTTSRVRRSSPPVSRAGSRTPRSSPAPTVKPARDYASPPRSNAANEASQRGNKISGAASSGSGDAASKSSSASGTAGARRGGSSRPGQHVPTNYPTPAGQAKPQLPRATVRSAAATELSEIVAPAQEHASHFSDSEGVEAGTWLGDRRSQKSRTEHARKALPPPPPPTLQEAATKTLYKGMRPIGHGIQIAGRRVSHLVSLVSPPSPRPKGAPGSYSGSPRVSVSSAVGRVATGLKGAKVVPPVPSRFPTPRFAPGKKIDKWEQQHLRYKDSHEVLEVQTYRRGGDEYVDDKADLFQEIEKELGEGEADDRGEDVDFADDEKDKMRGEYMTQQLQKMQNLPELAQMYDHDFAPPFPESPGPPRLNTRWVECCQLFQRDPSSTSIDERVQLAGLKTPLYLYQAFGVYWQMKTGRAVGGGFVADEMGLGKTLSFLAYFVAERQLAMLQWEMANPTRPNPANALKHSQLHLEAGQSRPDAICPSQKSRGPGWIACPCASPVTSALTAKPGVRLACVPPSLVPTWVEQWNHHIDEGNALLLLRLIIAHDASNEKPVGGGYDVRDVRHASNEKRMLAQRNPFDSSLHDRRTEFFEDGAQDHQERLLVLTTREYWGKHLARKYERKSALVWSPDAAGWTSGVRPGIVYGIAMIDECHEEFQKNKGRSGVLSTLPRSGRPFVWGYSGTPLTTTPRGIEGVLWAIERLWPKSYRMEIRHLTGLEQETQSGLELFSCQRLDAICRQFEDHVQENRGSSILFQDVYLRFKPFLSMFMLRRTADTPWFGQPLIKLPPHVHQDIILRHNAEYDGKIAQFEWTVQAGIEARITELQKMRLQQPRHDGLPPKLGFNADMRLRSPLRLMASFPYLVTLAAANHPEHLDLTVKELRRFRGAHEKRKANPYFHHLKAITESSPKMMWLYGFLTELDQTRDVDGQEHKVVIMSEFNQVALIVKLWIEHHLRDKRQRVGLVYAGMSPRARRAVVDSFTDAHDDKGRRVQRQNYQFLVGTTRIIGAGLQLTRSCHVVLMEPDCEFYRELQGYARVHRLGQRNPTSRSYRLVDAGNRWERKILERQAERGEFPGRADCDEESPHRHGDVTELISRGSEPASPREGEGEGEDWMPAVLALFPPPAEGAAVAPAPTAGSGLPEHSAEEKDSRVRR